MLSVLPLKTGTVRTTKPLLASRLPLFSDIKVHKSNTARKGPFPGEGDVGRQCKILLSFESRVNYNAHMLQSEVDFDHLFEEKGEKHSAPKNMHATCNFTSL